MQNFININSFESSLKCKIWTQKYFLNLMNPEKDLLKYKSEINEFNHYSS